MEAVTHVDTHVVVWLYAGDLSRFPAETRKHLERDVLVISPMVILELQYLHEIGRLSVAAGEVVEYLRSKLGLRVAAIDWRSAIGFALALDWTRDPFDRLIVATAAAEGARLLTKDETILDHHAAAFWPEA